MDERGNVSYTPRERAGNAPLTTSGGSADGQTELGTH